MKKTFAAIAACMVACAAQAGGFYVGGQLGMMTLNNWTDGTATSLQGSLGGSVTSSQDKQTIAGRIFAGYNINPVLGLELGYLQIADAKGSITGTTGTVGAYGVDTTVGVSGFDVSTVVHPFVPSITAQEAPTGFYLRAGVSQYTTTLTASTLGFSTSTSKTGTGTILGMGYDWKMGPGALRLDATVHQSMSDLHSNDSVALSVGYVYPF